jgi:biopolymer transport protein TolR
MALTANGRRIRKHKLKADINVVPYIDVMLVLLIIFMVTAPLMNLGVDVNLPQSNAKSIEEKKDPMVVSVDAGGNYFFAVQGGKNEAISAADLETKVRGIMNQNPQQAVFVAGDSDVPYQKVMDAMVLLQRAGVEKVGLMSEPEQGASQGGK